MQYKQLPTNPSLEHLKSQAKRLLKAHKEGSLDAFQRIRAFFPKLSDATDTEIQNAALVYRTRNWLLPVNTDLQVGRG